MQHLAGWFEDVDQAAAAADIAAMPDQSLTVSGDFVRCPVALPNLLGEFCTTIATTFTSARVESASLRIMGAQNILPVNRIATATDDPHVSWHGDNPRSLIGGEDVSFNTNSDHAAAIEIYGFVWFGDSPVQVANGEIFTVRATGAITLADGVWTNGALTFVEELPVGEYDVVGLRVESAGIVAARLVFQDSPHRPGVCGAIAPSSQDIPSARFGKGGVIGHFNSLTPPTVEAVGVTGTAQVVLLDLIKTG